MSAGNEWDGNRKLYCFLNPHDMTELYTKLYVISPRHFVLGPSWVLGSATSS